MIYSIGHGNKELLVLINELKSFNVEYVIDVRTSPYSKYNPQFNRETLQVSLKEYNITYIFLGDKLGGLPDPIKYKDCYVDGKVDYSWVENMSFYQEGIKRIIKAYKKGFITALMCSESKPEECHRSKLIGQSLISKNIKVQHIIGKDKIIGQSNVILKMNKGKSETDLFGNKTEFTSRKKYK